MSRVHLGPRDSSDHDLWSFQAFWLRGIKIDRVRVANYTFQTVLNVRFIHFVGEMIFKTMFEENYYSLDILSTKMNI